MAGETLGHEVLVEAEAGMPQLDFSTWPNLIFWLAVSLVGLYFILTRVALPRIGTVLAERNDAISNDLEQAALFKRRAEEAEAAYDAALAKAREESQKIAAETKAQINKELSVLMGKADAEIAAKSAEIREAHRRDPRKRLAERRGGRPRDGRRDRPGAYAVGGGRGRARCWRSPTG